MVASRFSALMKNSPSGKPTAPAADAADKPQTRRTGTDSDDDDEDDDDDDDDDSAMFNGVPMSPAPEDDTSESTTGSSGSLDRKMMELDDADDSSGFMEDVGGRPQLGAGGSLIPTHRRQLSDGSTTGSSGDLSEKLARLDEAVAAADVEEDEAVLRAAAVRILYFLCSTTLCYRGAGILVWYEFDTNRYLSFFSR